MILFDQECYKRHDGVSMIFSLGLKFDIFLFLLEKIVFKIILKNLNLPSTQGL